MSQPQALYFPGQRNVFDFVQSLEPHHPFRTMLLLCTTEEGEEFEESGFLNPVTGAAQDTALHILINGDGVNDARGNPLAHHSVPINTAYTELLRNKPVVVATDNVYDALDSDDQATVQYVLRGNGT